MATLFGMNILCNEHHQWVHRVKDSGQPNFKFVRKQPCLHKLCRLCVNMRQVYKIRMPSTLGVNSTTLVDNAIPHTELQDRQYLLG